MGGNPCAQVAEVGRTSWRRVAGSISAAESRLNRTVADSAVGRYFKLEARKSTFTREIRAGTAVFLTMAYIISVNTSILTDSGGPCSVADCNPKGGPDCKSIANPGYRACLAEVKNDLTVATILPAVAGSLLMGSLANLPFALAPGMGTNAFFTFNMVGFHGTGTVPYGTALGAIMVEGCLFLALSVLGLRSRLARIIPRSIRLASAVGIGMFLAFSGLQGHQGIGMVGPSPSTLVTLTACADVDPVTGACIAGGRLSSATFWLGVVGFLITAVCLAKDIKGSMVYGIIFVTLVSWIRNTSVTFFPNTDAGDASFNFFKKVVSFHVIKRTAGAISFTGFNRSEVWVALVTLLYVDVLDTTGGMYSMAEYGGFTADDDKGGFEGEYRAFMVDAGSTIMSSALGSTTVTTFVESTAGMREGGRTGITAIVVAVYFALSLFFTPLLASVPPWAVGPSLVIVGMMMMKLVTEIEWAKVEEGVPAFLTMVLMPLTFSISNGIIAGLGVHIAMHVGDYLVGMVRWVRKTKKMMEASQNQVSAASADATV